MSFPALVGLLAVCISVVLWVLPAQAAPYAAMVMDARTGQVLHSRNADTRLHPASLTKMMTLYIAFEAMEKGEISADTTVTISKRAAAEPPSRLGLRSGQKIKFRYLIRAAAVKSANDAATAIGEAISGSEAAFARRMNRTAKAMGMTRTTFKNAHGLTETGHMSTARDMTILGRHVFYDYPDYYHLFSRKSVDAGMRAVANTNRRFLGQYRGADGIKTGYTRAAGFNLVASAERRRERIITTVFGGRSTATRNARVAELMDLGFGRAPSRAQVTKPRKPAYRPGDTTRTARNGATTGPRAVKVSLRPRLRPGLGRPPAVEPDAVADALVAALQVPGAGITDIAAQADSLTGGQTDGQADDQPRLAATAPAKDQVRPRLRPDTGDAPLVVAQAPDASQTAPQSDAGPQIISRMSTSGDRLWGIRVGKYGTRHNAERKLLQTALAEIGTLDTALRKVIKRPTGFEANFVGMTQDTADLACRRLRARSEPCETIGPSG